MSEAPTEPGPPGDTVDALDPADVAGALRWLGSGTAGGFPRPVSVHLDLTFRCTARCVHCSQWTWPDQSESTPDQIDELGAVLRRWGVRALTVDGGNPLLHPQLPRLLHRATEAGIVTGLVTEGGGPARPETLRSVAEHLDWIRFSVDGPFASVHDDVRNVAGHFGATTATMRALRQLAPRASIGIDCVIQRRNAAHLAAMLPLAADLDVDVLRFTLPHGDDPGRRYLPIPDEWTQVLAWARREAGAWSAEARPATNVRQLAALLGNLLDPLDVAAGAPVRGYYTVREARCFVPLFLVVIDARGDVYPCSYLQADTRPMSRHYRLMRDEFRAGNVFTDGDRVLDNLGELLRSRVHHLPGHGYTECGSCTRHFQFNASMSAARG